MVREGISMTWSVLSWSGGREFRNPIRSNLGYVVRLSQVVLELNISSLKVLKHALLKEAWISRFFTALLNFNDFSGLHPMKANKPETNGGWESIYIKLPDFSAEVHHTTRCENIWSTLATITETTWQCFVERSLDIKTFTALLKFQHDVLYLHGCRLISLWMEIPYTFTVKRKILNRIVKHTPSICFCFL